MSEQDKKSQKKRKKKASKHQTKIVYENEQKQDSRATFTCSRMTDYPDDWEDEDIVMRSPTPKYNYGRVSSVSMDRSITALEPLESPRKEYSQLRMAPHGSTSETSPNHHRNFLPPISVTNLPTSYSPKSLMEIESKYYSARVCERQHSLPQHDYINTSKGGIAFAIGLNADTKPRKPPHFLEKLPAIPRKRLSSKDSWQNKQRIAEERHGEYIQTIADKARERSARQKRAAGKLREHLRQSREDIEERLRAKLSMFEENKNLVMREKLVKIRKMREREQKARRKLEKQRKALNKEQQIYEHLRQGSNKSQLSRPNTHGGDGNTQYH